jgi:hypothetical protein
VSSTWIENVVTDFDFRAGEPAVKIVMDLAGRERAANQLLMVAKHRHRIEIELYTFVVVVAVAKTVANAEAR